jgi:hypothetical protein
MSTRPRARIFLLAAAVIAPTAAFLALHLATPSDGARIQPGDSAAWQPQGIVLTPILDQPGGLAAGDLLVAVEGESLTTQVGRLLRFQARSPQWEFGQTLTYTVVRAGRLLDVPVKLGRYPLGAVVAQDWGSFAVTPIFLLVGLYLYAVRPGEPMTAVTLVTSALLASTTAWTIGLQVSDLYDGWAFWLHKFCSVFGYLWMWAGFVHLTLVFPKPQPVIRRHPWILAALYAAPVVVHALYVPVSRLGATSEISWLGDMELDVYGIALVYVVLGGFLAVRAYRATGDAISRLQVRWLLFALIFVALSTIGLGFVPEAISGRPLVGWDWIGLSAVVVPVAVVIAVLRYRLFDIDVIINRTLVYVPLTAILAGGYAAAIRLFQAFFVAATGDESDAAVILTTLILVSVFTPIRNGLQSQVDRRLQEPHGPARRLRAFDQQVQRLVQALDPRESVRQLLELAVEAYGSRGGAVYMRFNGREALVHSTPGWSGSESLRIPLEWGGARVGRLSLGPRLSQLTRPALSHAELEECARRVAHLVRLVTPGAAARGKAGRRPPRRRA